MLFRDYLQSIILSCEVSSIICVPSAGILVPLSIFRFSFFSATSVSNSCLKSEGSSTELINTTISFGGIGTK